MATLLTQTGQCLRQDWGHVMGVTVQVETGHHLCWIRATEQELQGLLKPATACLGFLDLERFGESLQYKPKQAACVEEPLEETLAW